MKNAIPYQLSYVVFYSDVELYSMRYVILRIPLLIPLLTIVFLFGLWLKYLKTSRRERVLSLFSRNNSEGYAISITIVDRAVEKSAV